MSDKSDVGNTGDAGDMSDKDDVVDTVDVLEQKQALTHNLRLESAVRTTSTSENTAISYLGSSTQ